MHHLVHRSLPHVYLSGNNIINNEVGMMEFDAKEGDHSPISNEVLSHEYDPHSRVWMYIFCLSM